MTFRKILSLVLSTISFLKTSTIRKINYSPETSFQAPSMKRDASPGSMHDTGCLGLVHWNDPEGWYGEGGGRRVQDGEHMYNFF